MSTYTLKLVGIEETGSIGRQLKATINSTSVDFTGTTNRHHVIASSVPISGRTNVPISIEVSEWDKRAVDGPYSGSTNILIDPASTNNPVASLAVKITEIGGKGKAKGKTATLTFHFQAEIKQGFDLRDIPGIMTAKGFTNGATLMNRWFAAPAGIAPAGVQSPDTNTIKMSWVLSYARAKSAYDDLIQKKLTNPAAIKAIKSKYGNTVGKFGDFSQPMPDLHTNNIQHIKVGNVASDPFDDMFCALGHFSLYVVVKGEANKSGIGITHIGIHVKDDYDFNGGQTLGTDTLGWWNKKTNYGGFFSDNNGATHVKNSTFRKFRGETGSGGDFYLYSDLIIIKLEKPIKILK